MVNVYVVSFSAYCPDDDDKLIFIIRWGANWYLQNDGFALINSANDQCLKKEDIVMREKGNWYLCDIFYEIVRESNKRKKKDAYLKKVSKYYVRARYLGSS